jgi:uncharacterized membrane protein
MVNMSWLLAALIVLLVLFVVLTYVSWATPLGDQTRYYYYVNAIFSLSIIVAIVTLIYTDTDRRRAEQKRETQKTIRINQRYWINLERFFIDRPGLNRLYKQMWPTASDIQALPNMPSTLASRRQEVHAANMLFGVISNMNAAITQNNQVLASWKRPEYRAWFATLKNWLQSDIVRTRWWASRDIYTPQMQTLIDTIINCASS